MSALRRTRYLVLGLLAAGLRAEPPAAPTAAPPEDAISAAKRDYDLIKGAKSSALDPQKMDLPRMEAPTMHLSSDEMAAFLESEAAQKKKAKDPKKGKSGNWLVDAMSEKKSDSREETKPEAVPGAENETDASLATQVKDSPRDEARSNPASSRQAPAVDNPLATYMSGWMTPKDLDLLKVKPEESSSTIVTGNGPGRPAESGMLDGLVRVDTNAGAGNATASGLASPTEPRANPYLAEFSPDNIPAAGIKELLSLPAPTGQVSPSTAPLLAPAPNDPGPAKTEPAPVDLLKPPSDAKYFPQLKRF